MSHSFTIIKFYTPNSCFEFNSRAFHIERFNLKTFYEVEGKDQFCVEISNRFAALVNFSH
jgi:hypothetical protein